MARTPSNMIPLGSTAPNFTLPDTVSGQSLQLNDVRGEKGTLIAFICNHCPFVKHINAGLVELAEDYQEQGFGFVAISSNDVVNYPEDHPDLMTQMAKEEGYTFPYLYDQSQEVAKAYDAACTPDFYVFDAQDTLTYRGQMDDSRPGNGLPVTGADLRAALQAMLEGKTVSEDQKPSIGCNIKWKSA